MCCFVFGLRSDRQHRHQPPASTSRREDFDGKDQSRIDGRCREIRSTAALELSLRQGRVEMPAPYMTGLKVFCAAHCARQGVEVFQTLQTPDSEGSQKNFCELAMRRRGRRLAPRSNDNVC